MTRYEFSLLPKREQAEAIWDGEYFWYREEGTCKILLYKVHNFYVEVHYDERQNRIVRLRPFSSK